MNKLFIYLGLFLIAPALASAVLYNTTNITNADSIYDMAVAYNDVVGGVVGYGMLAMAFAIPFVIIYYSSRDALAALSGSSFFTLVSSAILLPLNFIAEWAFTLILVITGISVMASILLKR